MFRLLQGCDVDISKAVAACARVREIKWDDLRCVRRFLYYIEIRMVLEIPACEGSGSKRGRDGKWGEMDEVKWISA